jgi:hypothetical protein
MNGFGLVRHLLISVGMTKDMNITKMKFVPYLLSLVIF